MSCLVNLNFGINILGSDDSSPMLTSDPTSDSSDAGCNIKNNCQLKPQNVWQAPSDSNVPHNQPEEQKKVDKQDKNKEKHSTKNKADEFTKVDNVRLTVFYIFSI